KTSICYRIEFNDNKLYEAYEFSVNNTGLLERLTFFYSTQDDEVNGQENDGKSVTTIIKPRLEIIFYDYQAPVKYSPSDFEDPQISVREDGRIDLEGDYKDYRLLDYR